MKAFFFEHYGKHSPLRFGDRPEPAMGDNDVLIDVHAASLNQLDAKIKSGAFKMIFPHAMPLILGQDMAGVVLKTGARVTQFQPGDAVYGCLPPSRMGTFAERVVADARYLARKPQNLSMEEAASLPLVALTAWQAFNAIAKVQPGQRVFIQAGSGGVGTVAIQLAKHLGASVATTAGAASSEKLMRLGADAVFDYRKDDFSATLKDYDVALMSQDAASLAQSLSILKRGGTAISISGPPDPAFARQAGLNPFLQFIMWARSYRVRAGARRAGLEYTFLFMQPQGDQLRQLTALIESGAIHPVIDKVFPFDQTAEAMAYLETGRAKGKVVVKIR
ncbi:NADP-dependent oxidoreductase [Ottowia sp.]|uniref:NADP-dependent oxidoreductase n=1 Tax=Ottowia sp. TaxID=1898956 RepID=UPI003A8B02B7